MAVAGLGYGLCGVVLVLVTYLSVMHTVFAPLGRPSLTARGVLRVVGGTGLAIGRRLPEKWQAPMLALVAPSCLFITAGLWVVALAAGFVLLMLALDPAAVQSGEVPRIGGVTVLLVFGWAMSLALAVAAFASHVVRFTGAYSRREVPVLRLAGQAKRPTDTDYVLAEYLRSGSRDNLDDAFADWSGWLADIRCTHVGYPALVYYRPATDLCWLRAAVIILDAAALTEAIAPNWSPPHTRSLLATGAETVKALANQLGIKLPDMPVSLHGREELAFGDSVQLAVSAGMPQERDETRAWEAFQRSRTSYAPQVAAIGEFLLYGDDVRTEIDRRTTVR